jgi:RNase adapter protein RapZ
MNRLDHQKLQIVVVTGLSGSGKSTVSRVLEDLGFYCIDNLPIALLPNLFEMAAGFLSDYAKIALVMDLRDRALLRTFPEVFRQLQQEGLRMEILFLEATDEVLVRRYSQTRRTHPLAEKGRVVEGIRQEREMLIPLRSLATRIIDTSMFNVHQLEGAVRDLFGDRLGIRRMTLTLLSFGYSRGIPQEADLVMDVRFLPNPYFVEELKPLPGTDRQIREFLFGFEQTREFVKKLQDLLEYLLPLYEREGKAYLTIAIGCTGGKHRSVAITEHLVQYFAGRNPVQGRHRDLSLSS